MHGNLAFCDQSLDAWWHLHLFVHLNTFVRVGVDAGQCRLCSCRTSELRKHLLCSCPVFGLKAEVEGWHPSSCFELPANATNFCAILSAVGTVIEDLR